MHPSCFQVVKHWCVFDYEEGLDSYKFEDNRSIA
jgi:hypothetical protein